MANSSGLNERPSRTSLRGVATLYQGSMPILLRAFHAVEEQRCRLLESCKVRVGDGLEVAITRVHPIADPIGNHHIARASKGLDVPPGLVESTLDTRAHPFCFDHEVAVLRRARPSPKHCHADASPLHRDALERPAQSAQQRHHEMRELLVLARPLTEGLRVLDERHQVRSLRY